MAGGGEVNLGGFEDQQIGILGRIGMEYRVTRNLGVDLGFNYEIFEPPPGTNATAALSGGLTIRI